MIKILLLITLPSTRAAPKVMSPTLLCWPTTSEADVGGMAVEVGPSANIPLHFVPRYRR